MDTSASQKHVLHGQRRSSLLLLVHQLSANWQLDRADKHKHVSCRSTAKASGDELTVGYFNAELYLRVGEPSSVSVTSCVRQAMILRL
jgi:hypothetical protein